MNIIQLRKLIKSLEKNPEENKKLISFYKQKDLELMRKINEEINEKLKKISPFINHSYNLR